VRSGSIHLGPTNAWSPRNTLERRSGGETPFPAAPPELRCYYSTTMRTARFLLLSYAVGACGPVRGSEDGAAHMTDSGHATMSSSSSAATGDGFDTSNTVATQPSATDGGDGMSDTENGVSFLADTDASPLKCDLWSQDCPEGDKCSPWSNDGTGVWNDVWCTPVHPDPDSAGASCTAEENGTTGHDSCGVGAICWEVDTTTSEGECVDLCKGTPLAPSCDHSDEKCAILNDGVLPLCLTRCDPVADDCGSGRTCRPTAPAGDVPGGFVCLPVQADGIIDACDGCPAEHACVSSRTIGTCERACCARYCDLEATPNDTCEDLPGDNSCVPFFAEPPEGLAHVGLCAPS
jgi:hypothetical protein